jgi:hypothetical protein
MLDLLMSGKFKLDKVRSGYLSICHVGTCYIM